MKANLQTFRCNFKPREHGLAWMPLLTVRRSATGSATRWHRHDEHEIIFLVDGSVTYDFRDEPSVNLNGGQFLVIPKGVEHHIRDDIDTPSFRLGFNIVSHTARGTPLTHSEYALLEQTLLGVSKRQCATPDTIRSDLITLARLVAAEQAGEETPPFTYTRIRTLCTRILLDCAEAIMGKTCIEENPSDNIDAAIAFVDSHAETSLDLAALIRHIGYSRARLYTLFRRKTGLTPLAYHQQLRLTTAKRLLETTDMPSNQVAKKLDFKSSTYFTYVFHRYFGITPQTFRLIKQQHNPADTTEPRRR